MCIKKFGQKVTQIYRAIDVTQPTNERSADNGRKHIAHQHIRNDKMPTWIIFDRARLGQRLTAPKTLSLIYSFPWCGGVGTKSGGISPICIKTPSLSP